MGVGRLCWISALALAVGSGHLLRDPILIKAGQPVRVSCVIDNGTAFQWGAGPGHDAPAVPPPLDLPAYHVGGNA